MLVCGSLRAESRAPLSVGTVFVDLRHAPRPLAVPELGASRDVRVGERRWGVMSRRRILGRAEDMSNLQALYQSSRVMWYSPCQGAHRFVSVMLETHDLPVLSPGTTGLLWSGIELMRITYVMVIRRLG